MENLVKHNFNDFFQGKKVLITGHTGFKGSWLSIWLHALGAEVVGYALDPVNDMDNFVQSKIGEKIVDIRGDIRDLARLQEIFDKEQPEIIFHLAAQALVMEGYAHPVDTYSTNIMGTVNVLECVRHTPSVKQVICITTDKVYDNKEWSWPYRESEALGGYDPYSSSKGACEIVIASYRNSFFNEKDYMNHGVSVASARAGNVIGGGDWAENRIVPDCIRALGNQEPIKVRNPKAIRPWQHVLEPLGGYLQLAYKMGEDPHAFNEAWNFGPESSSIVTVESLVTELVRHHGSGTWEDLSDHNAPHEATFLSLDINKAKSKLGWFPKLTFSHNVQLTVEWYRNADQVKIHDLCLQQIDQYINA